MPGPQKGIAKTPGSGRKKGSLNKPKTLIVTPRSKPAFEVVLSPVTPRDVMVETMLWFRQKAKQARKLAQQAEFRLNAVLCARYAAPYLHARLSAIYMTGDQAQPFVIRAPELITDADKWERLAGPRLEDEAEDERPSWAK